MEYGIGMLGEEVAERHTFIVSPHLNVKAVMALIMPAKMERGRGIAVTYFGTLAIERLPCGVHRLVI